MLETLCCTLHRCSSVQLPVGSLTPAIHNSYHVSSSHCAFHIHALPLAEQSLSESVIAISLLTPQRLGISECFEALLPMECVPEISLCLVPALNRGFLR